MNDINYEELGERVEKGVKRQKTLVRWLFLGINLFFFLMFAVMLIAAMNTPESMLNNLPASTSDIITMALILWPMGIFMQLMSALMESGVMDKQIAARVVGQELGHQLLESKFSAAAEKAKRLNNDLDDEVMTISDDGELVPLQQQDEHARRSGSR